ncbi:integral membrane sensor signal transduction histidine kinase [Calderihabitans maritimus]|uniref:histidine kinase n=2 Tax=Calderihabitans maritimus TaxID=1246530 RepID=A0A1Z5HRP6_9FIRM|nr:integral membrane sensor signal transduction histidine kinase [Calderihabitans maritimus]
MIRGIFARLLLSFWAIILVTVIILLLLLSRVYTSFYTTEKEKKLVKAGKEITVMAEKYLEGSIPESQLSNKIQGAAHNYNSEISIFPSKKQKTSQSLKTFTSHLTADYFTKEDIQKVLEGEIVSKITVERGTSLMSVAVPLIKDGQVIGGVSLHSPMYDVTAASTQLRRLSAVVILLAALIATILTYFLAKYVSSPLQKMSQAALMIAKGDFSVKVDVRAKDELGTLARSFNYMAEQLARVEKMRREFIANISHELRTPISFISGVLQGIHDKTIQSREQEKYVSLAIKETDRVSKLINDMLELSRLEHGDIKLELQKVDLQEVVLETLAAKEPEFLKKDLKPELNFTAKPYVLADPNRVKQMIINLLDNAIRFSPTGKTIAIGIEKTYTQATVWIRDYGPGIPEEEQEFIWDRFYKVDKTRKQEEGSSGLGLAITKMLAEVQRGSVGVKSQLGEGSTFYFSLPLWENEN